MLLSGILIGLKEQNGLFRESYAWKWHLAGREGGNQVLIAREQQSLFLSAPQLPFISFLVRDRPPGKTYSIAVPGGVFLWPVPAMYT